MHKRQSSLFSGGFQFFLATDSSIVVIQLKYFGKETKKWNKSCYCETGAQTQSLLTELFNWMFVCFIEIVSVLERKSDSIKMGCSASQQQTNPATRLLQYQKGK